MEGTEVMKDERESNLVFLRTKLAVMAAILAMGIAGLASTACHNPAALPQTATGATASLMGRHDAARAEANIGASPELSWGADAVTDASVMWGSFSTPATCEERSCKSPALPASGAAV